MKKRQSDELKEQIRLHKLYCTVIGGEGKKLDLSKTDLAYSNFYGELLLKANFSGANLKETNFSEACVSEVNFSGANLYRANFEDADLQEANFSGANLIGVDFSRAKLYGVNFSGTILEGKAFVSFQFGKDMARFNGLNEITIGYNRYTVSYWLENFEEIFKYDGYSEEQIKKYGKFIKSCAKNL